LKTDVATTADRVSKLDAVYKAAKGRAEPMIKYAGQPQPVRERNRAPRNPPMFLQSAAASIVQPDPDEFRVVTAPPVIVIPFESERYSVYRARAKFVGIGKTYPSPFVPKSHSRFANTR
jgi:hypothetical protein